MTTTRSLTVALAAAAALLAAGCGSNKNCNDATPPVSAVPASCSAQAGAQVTVPIHVCPKCDQAMPTCLVHAENAGAGQITLEPVSEVCDPNSSCPLVDPNSCPFATMNCTFTAPAVGTVSVTVVTPGAPETFQLAVSGASGSPPPVTCTTL